MRDETWTAVREAFAEIMAAPAVERTAFLRALEPEVRQEVESLLDAHDSAGFFLDPKGEVDRPVSGSTIGAYKLLDKIGEGGMGVVFRAERSDGEFRREVAIKLIGGRQFALEAERRFLFERQVLARLNHPHIVRMLDGGIAEGHRFLVMELVSGEPLVVYCDRRSLPPAARLRLFRDVCDAICHAHQNLVIHRDIKPGNILVTAEGEVKVLDFGVAQLALPGDSESLATHTLMRPMTLAYASPEQARGEAVTVATDIYSLGVLLYELLAGENPQSPGNLPLDEALQRICRTDPARLPRQYPADLNALVAKAMAKDPRARYGSANELMADIDRFQDGRPVLAQRQTVGYAVRKFVGRSRLLSAVTAALAFSVLLGLAAFFWQHRIAERERALAQSRFSQARRLIYTVIFKIQPKLETLQGATAIRAELLDSTLRYLQEMEKNAGNDPSFLRELARSYAELARVQGDMSGSNVGAADAASKSLESAQHLLRHILEIDPLAPGTFSTAGFIYRQAVTMHLQKGDGAQAKEFAGKAVDAARRLAELQPGDENRLTLANSLFAQGNATRELGPYLQALAVYESLLQYKPGDPNLMRNCALVHKNISGIYYDQSKPEALDEATRALELDRQILAAKPSDPRAMMDVAIDLSQASSAYEIRGDRTQAIAFASQSVDLRHKILDANPDDVRALDRLAFAMTLRAFFQAEDNLAHARPSLLECERVYQRLRQRTAMPGQSWARFARVKLLLGELEKQQGNTGAACAYFRESVDLFGQWKQVGDPENLSFREKALRAKSTCGN